MLFSSITFLYYFLPVTLLLYYAVPDRWKNAVLFAASFLFYAWGEPKYSLLLLFAVLTGYVGGILIEKANPAGHRRALEQEAHGKIGDDGNDRKNGGSRITGFHKKRMILLIFSGIIVVLLLIFKYSDFLVENINLMYSGVFLKNDFSAEKGLLPFPGLLLPLGISFYSFQIVSYLVDVYRGEISAERNFIGFGAYVTMFPQLVAGPIVRYSSIAEEMREHRLGWSGVADGSSRFVCGLAKKVLIADQLSELVVVLDGASGKGIPGYWGLAVAFTLQIYYDFSGYSDMAIGLGRMLGFTFPENFRYPFMAKSVTEFWRRWHMTLGGWFRDYVYIPLGGSRVPFLRWIMNVFVVWFLSGLWHGASWNFVLWGLYFGVLLLFEKGARTVIEKMGWNTHHIIGNLYTVVAVVISFVIFRQENLAQVWENLVGLYTAGWGVSKEVVYELGSYAFLLFVAIIGAFPILPKVLKCMDARQWLIRLKEVLRPVVSVLLLLLVTSYLIGSSSHPFLYFRF